MMKQGVLTIIFVVGVTFSAHSLECQFEDESMSFKDQKAIRLALESDRHHRKTGDDNPKLAVLFKLKTEDRIFLLKPGTKAEIVQVDHYKGESIMQVKIVGKGKLWIFSSDMTCK